MKFEVQLTGRTGKRTHVVELERNGAGYRVLLDGREVEADATQVSPHTISVLLGGQAYEVHVTPSLDGTVKLQSGPNEFTAGIQDPRAWRGRKLGAMEAEGRQHILAPMPGRVRRRSGSLLSTSNTLSPNVFHISAAVEAPIPLTAPEPRNDSTWARPVARRGTIESAGIA